MIQTIARKITVFILVFILFAHNINTLVIIGDFIVNQDFIAKTLCIQKENQQGCNGKCHLGKELAASESDSSSKNPLQENKRMALDAFCLASLSYIESTSIPMYSEIKKINIETPKITRTYFDIETPPPNFF